MKLIGTLVFSLNSHCYSKSNSPDKHGEKESFWLRGSPFNHTHSCSVWSLGGKSFHVFFFQLDKFLSNQSGRCELAVFWQYTRVAYNVNCQTVGRHLALTDASLRTCRPIISLMGSLVEAVIKKKKKKEKKKRLWQLCSLDHIGWATFSLLWGQPACLYRSLDITEYV